jgi:thiol-disulfide isomerase/thioredoxin
MKNIFVAVLLLCAVACNRVLLPSGTPVINTEIKNANGQLILAGHASPAVMQWPNYKGWFEPAYNSYATDNNSVAELKPLLKGRTMEIFLGSWCGDSRREVPRMLKILEQAGLDTSRLALIFVDNAAASYKQSPQHEEKGKDIRRVPTFILYQGKTELGRIVESPVVSLEKDLLSILRHEAYKANYATAAVIK